jgi:nicotinate-nucleotide pyrophosphorylase (carboxylating)
MRNAVKLPLVCALEKYATTVGGRVNHRVGLDDAVISKVSAELCLAQVKEAIGCNADVIMLDNMHPDLMRQAVAIIRQANKRIKIEASGNITLTTIRQVAETGVDYISTSAPITRSHWLDLSMRIGTS